MLSGCGAIQELERILAVILLDVLCRSALCRRLGGLFSGGLCCGADAAGLRMEDIVLTKLHSKKRSH